MKKSIVSAALIGACLMTGPILASDIIQEKTVISDNVRFCESTLPYKGGILIANFGGEKLNPMNSDGKGYILLYKDGITKMFIPADGNLSAPKGMYQQDDYLYICDVNRLVVYNLQKMGEKPQIVNFPQGDMFLNDLVAADNTLYISVTNTDRIYRLDISTPATVGQQTPVKWLDVPGPNGLVLDGKSMYIASYPADGKTTEQNIIYKVAALSTPLIEPFYKVAGQYDGIVLSDDKATLYISNWTPAEVTAIDMKSGVGTPISLNSQPIGAADMTLQGKTLYIPDLPQSRVIVQELK